MAAVALSSTIACSSSTAPAGEPIEFTVAPANNVPWSENPIPPTVTVSSRRLEITGVIHTPDPCYDLRGSAVRAGPGIMLTVTAAGRGGGCVASIGTFRYSAVTTDLPAGTYVLKVAYVYENTGWENREVLSTQVTVP